MTLQFVDTYFLLSLVNTKDRDHTNTVQHSQGQIHGLITTTWVLVEFADALSAVGSREQAARFIRGFQSQPYVEVVPPTCDQFDRALDRYQQRQDKDWSLTDCISFLLMEDRNISEALTADHHFEQAGFRALMKTRE